jgi:hypothetical protein
MKILHSGCQQAKSAFLERAKSAPLRSAKIARDSINDSFNDLNYFKGKYHLSRAKEEHIPLPHIFLSAAKVFSVISVALW